MERKVKIQHIYGYAVCLVSIITFLIAFTSLLNNIIDASAPLFAHGQDNNLASYQNYKMSVLRADSGNANYVPDEATIKQMYEDAKAYKINRVKHYATRSKVVDGTLIVLCILFFIFHWRWMKKIE